MAAVSVCQSPALLQALATFDSRHAELSQLVRPGMTLRFLRARGLNIDQAAAMIAAHMEWREQMQPEAITVAPGSGLDICDRCVVSVM